MSNYRNLTLCEFVDLLDRHVYACERAKQGCDRNVVAEAVARLDEMIGRLDQIEDIVRGANNV